MAQCESARLPPVWPGFDSRSRCHMWVEFVVGSRLCSERFFSGYSGCSPLLKNQHFQIPIRSWNPRATGLSVPDCCVSPSLNKVDLFIYLLIPLISSNLQILLRTVGKDFYTGFCRLHSAFYVLQNTSTCTLPSIEVPKCHGCSYLRL